MIIDFAGDLVDVGGDLFDDGGDPRNPCLDQVCFHNPGFGLSVCQTTITVSGIAFPYDGLNGTWVNTVDCADCGTPEVTGCGWLSDLTQFEWPGFKCCSGGSLICPGYTTFDGFGVAACTTEFSQLKLSVELKNIGGTPTWEASIFSIVYRGSGGIGGTAMTVSNIDFGNPFHVFGGWHTCGTPPGCDLTASAFAEADYGTVTVNPVWKALC